MSQWMRMGAVASAALVVGVTLVVSFCSRQCAAPVTEPVTVPEYRTQGGAELRWQNSQHSHWRQLALKRS